MPQVHTLGDAWVTCPRCHEPIWLFKTPDGGSIALDGSTGRWLTNGAIAYLSNEGIGYSDHADHCDRHQRSPLTGVVAEDEFLWS